MDEDIKKYFQDGKEKITVMGERFKPFLKVLIKNKVTDAESVCSIFGYYLSTRKVDIEGHKVISKFSFENFVIKLLYDIEALIAEKE